jgi:hypothetical protein
VLGDCQFVAKAVQDFRDEEFILVRVGEKNPDRTASFRAFLPEDLGNAGEGIPGHDGCAGVDESLPAEAGDGASRRGVEFGSRADRIPFEMTDDFLERLAAKIGLVQREIASGGGGCVEAGVGS